jgi:hypothetical protein
MSTCNRHGWSVPGGEKVVFHIPPAMAGFCIACPSSPDEVGVSEECVRSVLRRARAKLRKLLVTECMDRL